MNQKEEDLEENQEFINEAIQDISINEREGDANKYCADVMNMDVKEGSHQEREESKMTTKNELEIQLCCEDEPQIPSNEVPPSPGLDFLEVCKQHGPASRKSSEGGYSTSTLPSLDEESDWRGLEEELVGIDAECTWDCATFSPPAETIGSSKTFYFEGDGAESPGSAFGSIADSTDTVEGLNWEEGTLDSASQLEVDLRSYVSRLCDMVNSNDVEGVQLFIENHANGISDIAVGFDENGESAVTLSGTLGLLDIIQMLANAGVSLDSPDREGYKAIHRASYHGHKPVVEYLADQGLWSCKTKNGFTALHIAANLGHTDLVHTLLEFATDEHVDEPCDMGWTPLHMASQRGHAQIVEALICKGADVNAESVERTTGLLLAAQYGRINVAQVLVTNGADINFREKHGMTPLFAAMQSGHIKMSEKLIEWGVSLDTTDNMGLSALHKAAHFAQKELVSVLIDHKVDINAVNKQGLTSLSLATVHSHIKITEQLLIHGADPNMCDATGYGFPLYVACHCGSIEVVCLLMKYGANVNFQNCKGSTALYTAAKKGNLETLSLLLSSGADPNLCRLNGWTPLHVATYRQHTHIVKRLLADGADPNLPDNRKQTSLALAAYAQNSEILALMADHCARADAVYKVAVLGNCSVLRSFEMSGIELKLKDENGLTALHLAAVEGHLLATEALLGVGFPVNVKDNRANTPLHFASRSGHCDVVSALINSGAQLEVANVDGENVLDLAAQGGREEMVTLLIMAGLSVNVTNPRGHTPLHQAIIKGHLKVADLLMFHGADIWQRDRAGLCPVHLACQHGHTQILKWLMAYGGGVSARTTAEEDTCLHLASRHGHLDTVLELVLHKSDVNATNARGHTAIFYAAVGGHTHTVEALLDAGTKVVLLDEEGRVLYEWAKHAAVWEVLKTWAKRNPSMLEVPPTPTNTPATPGSPEALPHFLLW